jgi:hypothetical protein
VDALIGSFALADILVNVDESTIISSLPPALGEASHPNSGLRDLPAGRLLDRLVAGRPLANTGGAAWYRLTVTAGDPP